MFRDSANKLTGFCIQGHADFAASGQDVVCAAVSAVALTAAIGLEQIALKRVTGQQAEGQLLCQLVDEPDIKSEMILQTMLKGLQDISRQYPRHIKIIDS